MFRPVTFYRPRKEYWDIRLLYDVPGSIGTVFDSTLPGVLHQESTRITPAITTGDPIGSVTCSITNSNYIIMADTTRRPIVEIDPFGLKGISTNGTTQRLQLSGANPFTSSEATLFYIGINRLGTATAPPIFGFGRNAAESIQITATGDGLSVYGRSRGDLSAVNLTKDILPNTRFCAIFRTNTNTGPHKFNYNDDPTVINSIDIGMLEIQHPTEYFGWTNNNAGSFFSGVTYLAGAVNRSITDAEAYKLMQWMQRKIIDF